MPDYLGCKTQARMYAAQTDTFRPRSSAHGVSLHRLVLLSVAALLHGENGTGFFVRVMSVFLA